MRPGRATSAILLSIVIVLSVAATPGLANPPSSVPDGQTFEATNSVDVWERAVFPLRADFDGAATEVPIGDLRAELEGTGEQSLNKDPVGVVNAGTEVTITFDQARASSDDLADARVEVIAARVTGSDQTPTTFSEAIDLISTDNANENATFEAVTTQRLDADGEATFSHTPETPGHYVYFIAGIGSGDGFEVTNGDISSKSSVTLLGVEQVTAQRGPATVAAPGRAAPGNDITFTVNTRRHFSQDDVTHVLAVYNEETFTDITKSTFTVRVDEGSIDSDFDASEDSTLEHSISETNGVADVEDGIEVAGNDLADGRVSGPTDLGAVIDFVGDDLNANPPATRATGDTRLDASMTAVASDSPRQRLTVETFSNWSAGTYRYVYVGTLEDNGSAVSTQTGTFSIRPRGSSGGGGGDPSEDASSITKFNPGVSNAQFILGSSISVQGLVTGDATVAELDEFDSDVATAPQPFVGGARITVPQQVRDAPGTVELVLDRDRVQRFDLQSQDLQAYKYRSQSRSWAPLATEVVSVTEDRITVSFETDGFSLFAISSQAAQQTTTTAATSTSTPPPETATPAPTATQQPATGSPTDETEGQIPGFGPLVAIGAVLTFAFFLRRRA